ncbi:MAG: 50S ribosomal protein L6 [Ignavibacteriales bacterium]|nr:50S ribosomal protein L6 [Ignavibacteriales bacterium]
MSRIGKQPIEIPSGVTATVKDNVVTIKGPKGELTQAFRPEVNVALENDRITVTRRDDTGRSRAQHGLARSLVSNMVVGVSEGYSKTLDVVGVGFRVEMKGKNLLMNIGYSHPIYFMPPEDVELQAPTQTQIVVSGYDKQLVGQVAAKIRSFREPEPYKGKGIKYSDEYIRRKAGKTAK